MRICELRNDLKLFPYTRGFGVYLDCFYAERNEFYRYLSVLLAYTKYVDVVFFRSPSQPCRLFWISKNSPFKEYTNFYKFSKDYVIPKLIYTAYGQSNDYSNAKNDLIAKRIEKVLHKFTQEEAGFKNVIVKKNIFI